MGWSIGYDSKWKRDIGYGVPSICDHPDCNAGIDRGLSYVCGGEPYGGDTGCGLFFCGKHLWHGSDAAFGPVCERCGAEPAAAEPFEAKPDTEEWNSWKLTDSSWAEWRAQNSTWIKSQGNPTRPPQTPNAAPGLTTKDSNQ